MHPDDEICSLKSALADTQKFARDLQGELAASRVACEGAVSANRLNEAEVTRLLADNIRLRAEAAARNGFSFPPAPWVDPAPDASPARAVPEGRYTISNALSSGMRTGRPLDAYGRRS